MPFATTGKTILHEWDELPQSPFNDDLYKTSIENQHDNRYSDVLALESTRVNLSNYFYINANYIQISDNFRTIATQAPLPTTFENFWQMIIDNKTAVIVMLTKLTERNRQKADCYWPTSKSEPLYFDNFSVHLSKEYSINENTHIREFIIEIESENDESDSMEDSGENTILNVKHIHFTGWPDFGVPESTEEIRIIAKIVLDSTGVPVVHCSAGIGRAGSFLAIVNYFYQHQNEEKKKSVFDIVSTMRNQRMGIVQTYEQYCFIYQTINDECSRSQTAKVNQSRSTSPPPLLRSSSTSTVNKIYRTAPIIIGVLFCMFIYAKSTWKPTSTPQSWMKFISM